VLAECDVVPTQLVMLGTTALETRPLFASNGNHLIRARLIRSTQSPRCRLDEWWIYRLVVQLPKSAGLETRSS